MLAVSTPPWRIVDLTFFRVADCARNPHHGACRARADSVNWDMCVLQRPIRRPEINGDAFAVPQGWKSELLWLGFAIQAFNIIAKCKEVVEPFLISALRDA